ncbi:CU044_2847 family protein [Streptomyces sp. NPDC048251]|uniref:CU044_2847 family protein n=1 Tax=Streptomyces sp. NPDC048251 TaxID=3154501 RepID=UPI00344A0B09
MTELVRWRLDSGGEVIVEVPPDGPSISPVSRTGGLVESAGTSLSSALGNVRQAASDVLGQFRAMDVRPGTIEVEFGVKLTAEAGAIIAKTSAEGHLNVRLTWENDGSQEPRPAAPAPPD